MATAEQVEEVMEGLSVLEVHLQVRNYPPPYPLIRTPPGQLHCLCGPRRM